MRPHVAKARCRCLKCGASTGIAGYFTLKTWRNVSRFIWCACCGWTAPGVRMATDEQIRSI